jgi:DNA-nicking Smr family endonuclease
MGKRRARSPKPSGPTGTLHVAIVEDERDLHQLTAAEAAAQLEAFLLGWSSRRSGAVVRVITGRGNRSPGGPVLRPLVRELLAGRLAPVVEDWVVETGGGAYLIRVRGRR